MNFPRGSTMNGARTATSENATGGHANTWEAVYFDHDLPKLLELAEIAAEIGVERFVLDDGSLRHRKNHDAGLSDWCVDAAVWPEGLHPLTDRVTELGMEFRLWVGLK
ncbi:alpha-galactosidase [Acaricomes phytoseiuli]|uniref:alpha-galactosidase n=1 Tax=Acaricomes phytoseiuli TaxID=291968 RepID=UPI0003A86709|nr:alpha-galactosidase [Acaricomes phytoseiuli]MCW1250089.1 alpha-galactosidase [Acaricomes phytoseiuli]